jgi:hypothetical protein
LQFPHHSLLTSFIFGNFFSVGNLSFISFRPAGVSTADALHGLAAPEGFGVSMNDFELLKVLGTGGSTFNHSYNYFKKYYLCIIVGYKASLNDGPIHTYTPLL